MYAFGGIRFFFVVIMLLGDLVKCFSIVRRSCVRGMTARVVLRRDRGLESRRIKRAIYFDVIGVMR